MITSRSRSCSHVAISAIEESKFDEDSNKQDIFALQCFVEEANEHEEIDVNYIVEDKEIDVKANDVCNSVSTFGAAMCEPNPEITCNVILLDVHFLSNWQ